MEIGVWKKSSASGSGDNCVEVMFDGTSYRMRDTKDRDGGTQVYSEDEWSAFKVGVIGGEF